MKNFLEIKNATFFASKVNVIKNVSFNIKKKGDIICLLGASGIGKTTILRTIAGLQKLKLGKILLDNKLLSSSTFNCEPEHRNIALSFQENCLFPNKNIIENINIGSNRNKGKSFIIKTNDLIKIFKLNGLEKKYPHEISSGESQRVSIVRSLVSNPKLLLLDEPFSNIDESLKINLQSDLKKIIKQSKITTIIVTHDSSEAFYLSDYCGIFIDKSLEQFDTPYNIYHYPKSKKLIKFLNRGVLVKVKTLGNNKLYHNELGVIHGKYFEKHKTGTFLNLLIQPEDLEHDDTSTLKLRIVDRKFRGTDFIYSLQTKDKQIIPIFVHSHHKHLPDKDDLFGIKKPIKVKHLVCFK